MIVMARTTTAITVGRRRLTLSNLEKVLYPSVRFTKGDMVRYYSEIAPHLLPHLKNRPITLKRYPDGVDRFFFYEKACPRHRPSWVRTVRVPSSRGGGAKLFCTVDDLPALVWLANLASIELHISLARAKTLTRPDMMVYDLDPGPPADIVTCAQVALRLREKLSALQLDNWIKTSGSKGLQLYVPLNTPTTFAETKAFAHQLADLIASEHPRTVVSNMRKALRKGKVLIDWSQNDRHKTTVSVYSLRATPEPSISTPLQWSEVERLCRRGDAESMRFSPADVLARVRKHGDLFAPLLTKKQRLPR